MNKGCINCRNYKWDMTMRREKLEWGMFCENEKSEEYSNETKPMDVCAKWEEKEEK